MTTGLVDVCGCHVYYKGFMLCQGRVQKMLQESYRRFYADRNEIEISMTQYIPNVLV
jgi:hypothetical protein